jgi:hypothetical protein
MSRVRLLMEFELGQFRRTGGYTVSGLRPKRQLSRQPGSPVLVQASMILVAILCLWATFEFYDFAGATEAQSQNRDPYKVEAQFERLSGVLRTVPETAILGYLTDAEAGSTLATVMFDTAQYAVAPRLLRTNGTGDWVLGNFTRPLDYQSIGASHGLSLYKDFGNGVVLYRKGDR